MLSSLSEIPLFLRWLIADVAAFVVFNAVFIHFRYRRPLQALLRVSQQLVQGQFPRTYYIDGPPWIGQLSRDLENVAQRLDRLTRQQQEEDFNLNALLGNMVEGVMVVDQRHIIRLVNKELINLFELKNSPLKRTVLEALREASVEVIVRETIVTGQPQRREVVLISQTGGGTTRTFDVSAVPIREKGGVIGGAVAVFHDITRIKQLETMRRDFVANVSHELRTPLAIFRGYLETLLEYPDMTAKESRRVLETMQRHSNRLNALVEDLLTLTRLESTRVELQLDVIRLDPFLRQLVEDWQKRFREIPAHIEFNLAETLPSIEVDTLRIEQVFFNLLDNAVAYSNAPRKIHLSAKVGEENQVEIRLRDNGIGIPPADLPHIFERFYRVDKGRSRTSGGTGLGLSIVKHIMQIHGGSVQVESELAQGTAIILKLPIDLASTESS